MLNTTVALGEHLYKIIVHVSIRDGLSIYQLHIIYLQQMF